MAWIDDIINSMVEGTRSFLQSVGLLNPPGSVFTIIFISILVSLISISMTKLLTDQEKMKKQMKEYREWNELRKQAMRTANKKLWLKVKKQEEYIKQMNMSMMKERMYPMLFLTIPFILLFAFFRLVFVSHVAYVPFVVPSWVWPIGGFGGWVDFTAFYIFSGISLSALIQKLLGVSPQMGQ